MDKNDGETLRGINTGEGSIEAIDVLFSEQFLTEKREDLAKIKVTAMTQNNMERIVEEMEQLYMYIGSIAKELHDHKKKHTSVADCEREWDKT